MLTDEETGFSGRRCRMKGSKGKYAIMLSVLMVFTAVMPVGYAFGEEANVEASGAESHDLYRIAVPGGNRYSTAGAVAKARYEKAETVILVRGDNQDGTPQVVDALAASGLAGIENAPVLLTPKDELHKETKKAILELEARKVIVIGGTGAVSEDVIKELEAMEIAEGVNITTERVHVEGGDRYSTAAAVARKMSEKTPSDTAIITGGRALVDSLVAGPLAHNDGYPLLLVGKEVPKATSEFLEEKGIKNLIVIGGEGVVSPEVYDELSKLVKERKGEIKRVAGDDAVGRNRYGTSVNVYNEFFQSSSGVTLVNGVSFVDAVAASVLGLPILYVQENNLRPDVESILKNKEQFRVVGGSGVISDEVLKEAFYTLFPHLRPEEPDDSLKLNIQHTNYEITLRGMVDKQTSFVEIKGSTVNVREEPTADPGNTDNVIGHVTKGQEFKFYDTRRVADVGGSTYTWYQLDLRTSEIKEDKGWVRGDLLDLTSRAQTDLYGGGWKHARQEDVEYYVNPDNFYYDQEMYEKDKEKIRENEKLLRVKNDRTNLRRDPSTKNPALAQVNAGNTFRYINTAVETADDQNKYTWYEVDVKEMNLSQDTGWLRADVVEKVESKGGISLIPSSFFQFLVLSGPSGATGEDLNNILNNRGILHNTGHLFEKAGEQYDINEIYLVSHALLETGNGRSTLATGAIQVAEIEPNRWVSVQPQSDGKDKIMIAHRYLAEGSWRWNLYEDKDFDLSKVNLKKTYNMFGIGAVDAAPYTRGSVEAYRQGWFSAEKAIVEGSEWISLRYVNHQTYRQDTLYKMRWNPERPGIHQYATDIGWAYKQTSRIKALYELCENFELRFDVPRYKK